MELGLNLFWSLEMTSHTHTRRIATIAIATRKLGSQPICFSGIPMLGETKTQEIGHRRSVLYIGLDTIGWGKKTPKGKRHLAASCHKRRKNTRRPVDHKQHPDRFLVEQGLFCSQVCLPNFSHFVPSHFHTLPRILARILRWFSLPPSHSISLSAQGIVTICN